MIQWAGLFEIKDGKILMVREPHKDFFVLPGGKQDPGETSIQTLQRELQEELGVTVNDPQLYGEYELEGKSYDSIMHFAVFTGEIVGDIVANPEYIAEIAWLDETAQDQGIKVGNVVKNIIFPSLQNNNL
ncbi:NUDIX domain-containing protein [candidate division WWE3 bacterium]|uniref:NUDIX domain-containing protein n=1 Tax=candidate division WWE3 bacterium TaxID=2053526 RepID=A0A955RPN3_UNCKA|nr:NUDIX domain-containing protein [candidate division WWE3 bacterium]